MQEPMSLLEINHDDFFTNSGLERIPLIFSISEERGLLFEHKYFLFRNEKQQKSFPS